jgi:hypothetical protein
VSFLPPFILADRAYETGRRHIHDPEKREIRAE